MAEIKAFQCDLCGKIHLSKEEYDKCPCICRYMQELDTQRFCIGIGFNYIHWRDILNSGNVPFHIKVEDEDGVKIFNQSLSYSNVKDLVKCLENVIKEYDEKKERMENA